MKKNFQYFALLLENVPPKFPKSTNRTPKKSSSKKSKLGIKNAEFCAEYKAV